MSHATAKFTRQPTEPEMTDYLESEIYALCEAIKDNGESAGSAGIAKIKFIELFKIHTNVSNRMLGVLIKARKQGYLTFKGELLLQGKDDNEIITLVKMPPQAVQITKTQMIRHK